MSSKLTKQHLFASMAWNKEEKVGGRMLSFSGVVQLKQLSL